MLHREFVVCTFAFAFALIAPCSVSAQCIECGMQMQQAWHANVVRQGIYDSMKRDDARRQAASPGRDAKPVTERQLQDAALAPLWPEYQRRMQADGGDNAARWAVAAGKDLGHQVAGLMPEYRQLVRSKGQAAANDWYLDAARQTSVRYIRAAR